MAGGNKSQKSTSTSTPFQSAQFGKLLSSADQWLSGGGFQDQYAGGRDIVADFTPEQQAGLASMGQTGATLSDIYNGAGTSSLSSFLGEYDPAKTGLKAAQGAAAEQAMFDFETGQIGNIRQGAQNAGQFGSTRAGIAEGLARGRLAQGIAANNANMALADQQNFRSQQLQTLGNLTGITKGLSSGGGLQFDTGGLAQQQQQKEIQGDLQKWAYENNVDLNELLAYKELISGDMGGTNTQKTKGGGGGGLGAALGTLGGAALGGMFGGVPGATLGANLGGSTGAGILG